MDRFGLKETTAFVGDAIGIDPPDCGCTDCILGDSVPLAESNGASLAAAIIEGGREVVNRLSGDIYLVIRDGKSMVVPDLDGGRLVSVISDHERFGAEGAVTHLLESEWHADVCGCREWTEGKRCAFHMSAPTAWSVSDTLRALAKLRP